MKTLLSTILLFTIISCSGIQYQKRTGTDNWATGYYDKKISNNTYLVGFQGNGKNRPDEVEGFFLKRSAEIAQSKKFKGFCVLSDESYRTGYAKAPWHAHKGKVILKNDLKNNQCYLASDLLNQK